MRHAKMTFFVILLSLFCTNTYAGKIYKIVGPDGKVTFSQTPHNPMLEEEKAAVEEVSANNESMSTVTDRLGSQYCGDIKLPSQSSSYKSSNKYYSKKILSSLERWNERLDELTERYTQFSTPSGSSRYYSSEHQRQRRLDQQERKRENLSRVRDLRCAIHWAEQKQQGMSDYLEQDKEERERLQGILARLEGDLNGRCGAKPDYDPTDAVASSKRKRWYQCSEGYIKDINRIKKRLRRL